MSNRAQLLNTAVLSSDVYALQDHARQPGQESTEVAEGVYRIPIPWLRMFRQADLRMVPLRYDDEPAEGEEFMREIALPCTTVQQAILNIEESLPLFEQLAGNPITAREYWQDTLEGLRQLPLPYLTMNPLEVLFMDDPEESARKLSGALGDGAEAIEYMKELAGYIDGAWPYPLDVLRHVGDIGSSARTANAVALDASIGADPPPGQPPTLGSIGDQLKMMLKPRFEQVWPAFGLSDESRLDLRFSSASHAQEEALRQDPELLQALNRLKPELARICRDYGFSWDGVVFESRQAPPASSPQPAPGQPAAPFVMSRRRRWLVILGLILVVVLVGILKHYQPDY